MMHDEIERRKRHASMFKMAINLTISDYCSVKNRKKRRNRKKKFFIEDIVTTQTTCVQFAQVDKMTEQGPLVK